MTDRHAKRMSGEAFMHYLIQQETARLYPHAELVEQVEWPLSTPWAA